MKAIIFCGGVGTRLWPLSRKKSPKQFEKIIDDKSTLQLAVERLMPEFQAEDIYISTSFQYVETVAAQLPFIPRSNILGEPAKRDVGPAVAYVAGFLARKFPNEPVVILWSDHLVKKPNVFKELIQAASKMVLKHTNSIIFIGQKPRFASENLGWIQLGKAVHIQDGVPFYEFAGFQYKPNSETAHRFFHDEHYCWNLGYFVSTPAFLLQLFKLHAPAIYNLTQKICSGESEHDFHRLLNMYYAEMPVISFDNAVLEQLDAKSAHVVVGDIDWSDLGAWEALKEALEERREDNIIKGNVLVEKSNDALIYNYEEKKLIVAVGLKNAIVVNTEDVILVADKSSVKEIKKIVENFAGTPHEHLS